MPKSERLTFKTEACLPQYKWRVFSFIGNDFLVIGAAIFRLAVRLSNLFTFIPKSKHTQ